MQGLSSPLKSALPCDRIIPTNTHKGGLAMTYHGLLIRTERLRRNWSQEGLCRGICAVSYLSKIEQGKAEPSEDVLHLLLERLVLDIDPATQRQTRTLADEGCEALFAGETGHLDALLAALPTPMPPCPASLELQLLKELRSPSPTPLDEEWESCLPPRALALQRLLQGRREDALRLSPSAYVYFCAGAAAYERGGNDPKALTLLQTAYDLAAREGAAQLMLDARVLMGNCYCNRRDMEGMNAHYAVARRLARALGKTDIIDSLDYNTAAAQLERGELDAAYAYFSALTDPDAMSLHKLAISCEKLGKKQEAFAALNRAAATPATVPDRALTDRMCALVRYRLEHTDYLRHAAYGELLLDCFDLCRRQLPIGYAKFHLPWVLEWYSAARQYKKAAELLMDFPNAHSFT